MSLGPIRILFVESDPIERGRVEQFVRDLALQYELHIASSAVEAVRHLHAYTYDIALLNYRFSDGTAFDLLGKLAGAAPIFIADPGDEEIAVMALERGAYDYIVKWQEHNYLLLLPATIQKVLARKRAEEALYQSDARCQDLLDNILGMYFCLSQDGKVLLVNRAGALQLQYTVGELVGQPFAKVIHSRDIPKVQQLLQEASKRPDAIHRIEFRKVRKDGTVMDVEGDVRVQPVRGTLPPVIRILSRDITVWKKVHATVAGAKESARKAPIPGLEAPPPKAAPPVPKKEVAENLKGTEKLLIVDDVREQREVAARMLSKLGYRVVTAENGKAALQMIKSSGGAGKSGASPFDLILMDMSLEKDFDGLDTYKQVVKMFPGQKCVIISGGGETDRVKKAQTLGAGLFISKPYTFATIGRAVRDELDRRD